MIDRVARPLLPNYRHTTTTAEKGKATFLKLSQRILIYRSYETVTIILFCHKDINTITAETIVTRLQLPKKEKQNINGLNNRVF